MQIMRPTRLLFVLALLAGQSALPEAWALTVAPTTLSFQAVQNGSNPPSQTLDYLAPQLPAGDMLLLYRETFDNPPQTRSVRIASSAA